MRVAVVHHHLRRGGVTEVVRRSLASLRESDARSAILLGEKPPPGSLHEDETTPIAVVDGLGYASADNSPDPSALATNLQSAAKLALGGDPDVWHVHNPSLGKNPALTVALREIAESGGRLLLHIHDFAEDGRPANYEAIRHFGATAALFPDATSVHYAVLNRRDLEILTSAGCPRDRAHSLPNPVVGSILDGVWPEDDSRPPLVLYPTRAIRRKNLGELLLWSAVQRGDARFATTLIPENPAEKPLHDDWQRFAEQLRLPVEFGIGMDSTLDFAEIVASACWLITTSVAEGFGLAFLEPWLLSRPLLGRDLPEITMDFTEVGCDLSALYPRLDVPLEWIGEARLRGRIECQLTRVRSAYGRSTTQEDIERALRAAAPQESVDFGRLDPLIQRDVIERVAQSSTAVEELAPSSLDLTRMPLQRQDANRHAVERHYNLERYGERLRATYTAVAESPAGAVGSLDADAVLDAFLSPERFSLLRT